MKEKLITKVKLLSEKAILPKKAHESDTGYDLVMIGVHKITDDLILFKTGVSLTPPAGYYYEVVPRSSIIKVPLQLANSIGVIDEHYTGEILVPMRVIGYNPDNEASLMLSSFGKSYMPETLVELANLILEHKPSLCQLILRKRYDSDFITVDSLDDTERGAGGFGSTDTKK